MANATTFDNFPIHHLSDNYNNYDDVTTSLENLHNILEDESSTNFSDQSTSSTILVSLAPVLTSIRPEISRTLTFLTSMNNFSIVANANDFTTTRLNSNNINRSIIDSNPISIGGRKNDPCDAYVSFTYELIPLIISAVLLIAGLVYSFFGYRLYKLVLFVSGFVFVTALVFLLCERERLLTSTLGNAGVAMGCGALMGIVTLLVPHAGLFLTGLLSGLPGGLVLAACLAEGVWINGACLAGITLFLAVATLRFQRIMLTLNTASLGGAAIAVAADYMTHKWHTVKLIEEGLGGKLIDYRSVCWFDWASFSIWPILCVLGFIVQLWITAAGFTHKTGWPYYFRHKRCYTGNRQCQHASSLPANTSRNGVGRNLPGHCEMDVAGSMDRRQCRHPVAKPQRHCSMSSGASPPMPPFASLGSSRKASNTNSRNGANGTPKRALSNVRDDEAPRSDTRTSFTHLYQARRRHGDVICQSYMESLQKLAEHRKNSTATTTTTKSETNTPTIISDRTQLTILSTGSNSNSGSV